MMHKPLITCFLLLSGWMIQAQNPVQTNDWKLPATITPGAPYFGITSANGMVGLVSDAAPLRVKDVVLNGVFDRYGRGRVSNILRGFNFANLALDVQPAGLATARQSINAGNVTNLQQELNMHNAVFTTRFQHRDLVQVSSSFVALRHLTFTSLISLEVTALKDVDIYPASIIEAPEILREVHNYYSYIDRPHAQVALMTSTGNSPTGKHQLAASNSFLFEKGTKIPALVHEELDYGLHQTKFHIALKAGETFRFYVVASELSTAHYADPQNEAERITLYAALEGQERLMARHEAAWDSLWKSDIVIEGDAKAQSAVRSALYHLYAFNRAGTAYSPSPMGLSGLGYNGHVFWDTELWMFPPLLMLHPDLAKSMIEYRYERLEMARQNAFAHGYQGAMFPWESDDEGQEATPVWALTGPFEHHVTGCVGVAAWNYYCVTKDKNWLETRGYPLLKSTADFWVSRVERDEKGVCHIRNVVGADEWAENVDDNAFTNGVAITNLRYATLAAQALGVASDPQWNKVADAIPILTMSDGTTREYAGYQDTTIKQADANLLAYPLKLVADQKAIRRDLAFYEPRISETGPAMGNAVLSILYSRLGEKEKATALFDRAYQPNEVPPFAVLSECKGCSNPYFATGAGGLLQAVLNGFGGLEITDQGITQLKTSIPSGWKSLTIKGVGPEKKTYYLR